MKRRDDREKMREMTKDNWVKAAMVVMVYLHSYNTARHTLLDLQIIESPSVLYPFLRIIQLIFSASICSITNFTYNKQWDK